MNSGIYQIRNTINNKIYIGSTKSFWNRKIRHLSNLKINAHHSLPLQRAYNKYGETNFIFEILLFCDSTMLAWYEQQFLDEWKPEYNVKLRAYGGASFGHVVNSKTRSKISKTLKGRPNKNLAKTFKGFISPEGKVYKDIFNMNEFCREHNLIQGNLWKVNKEVRNSHRGWTLYRG